MFLKNQKSLSVSTFRSIKEMIVVKNVSTLLLLSINFFKNIPNKTIDSFEIVATKCLTLNTMHMIVTLVL